MSSKNSSFAENVVLAIALLVGGGAYLYRAIGYGLGSAGSPGPGYFPALLGGALAVLASCILLRTVLARRQSVGSHGDPWPVRAMVCLLTAIFAFGILLRGVDSLGFSGIGLVPACAVAVLIAGRASRSLTLKSSLLQALFLSVGAWLIFVEALGLLIPAWPWSY